MELFVHELLRIFFLIVIIWRIEPKGSYVLEFSSDKMIKKRSPASYQDRTDDRWFTRPALYH
jgi:hypothetical protein